MPCIVVKRGDYATYDLMFKNYGRRLPVVWDRRRARPPSSDLQSAKDRRDSTVPVSWTLLGFVVAQDSTRR